MQRGEHDIKQRHQRLCQRIHHSLVGFGSRRVLDIADVRQVVNEMQIRQVGMREWLVLGLRL